MPMTPYDGTVIDPYWIDIAGRGDDFPSQTYQTFYRKCCEASYRFRLGDWRRRRRDAEARNDFAALDRLDREYEMLDA